MIERRFMQSRGGLAVTKRSGAALGTVRGYAARFNCLSHDLGGFREIIRPGAFTAALAKPSAEVFALFNHSKDMVLGSTASGTLRLFEDSRGLRFEVDMPDTALGRDLLTLMRRGDVVGASFAFSLAQGGQKFVKDSRGHVTREIHSVAALHDASIVTAPAYPQAYAAAEPPHAAAPASLAAARSHAALALSRMRRALAATG
jgi:HK97 family phage prohead protease